MGSMRIPWGRCGSRRCAVLPPAGGAVQRRSEAQRQATGTRKRRSGGDGRRGRQRGRAGAERPHRGGVLRALRLRAHVPGAGERRAGGVSGHRDRVPAGGHRCLRDRDQRDARVLQAGERRLPLREGPHRSDSQGEEWGAPGEDHQQPPPLLHPVAPHPAETSPWPRCPPASRLDAFLSSLRCWECHRERQEPPWEGQRGTGGGESCGTRCAGAGGAALWVTSLLWGVSVVPLQCGDGGLRGARLGACRFLQRDKRWLGSVVGFVND